MSGKKLTDEELMGWLDREYSDHDEIFGGHFSAMADAGGIKDWIDSGEEASRMFGVMWDMDVQKESPICVFFQEVSFSGADSVIRSLSEALGISRQDLHEIYMRHLDGDPKGEILERVKTGVAAS